MDCGEIEVQSTEILFFIRDFQQPLNTDKKKHKLRISSKKYQFAVTTGSKY
jgi:hypothetical protein